MCYPGTNCFLGKGRHTHNTLSPDTSPQILLTTCLCAPFITTALVWDVHISRHLTSSWVNVNTLPEEVWDLMEFSTDWEIAIGSGVRLSGSYSWTPASLWGQAANSAVPTGMRDGQRNSSAPFNSQPMRVFSFGVRALFWNTGETQETLPEYPWMFFQQVAPLPIVGPEIFKILSDPSHSVILWFSGCWSFILTQKFLARVSCSPHCSEFPKESTKELLQHSLSANKSSQHFPLGPVTLPDLFLWVPTASRSTVLW